MSKCLLGERSEPHTGVFNRDFVFYCRYVVCRMSVVCQINCIGGMTWPTRTLKVFFGRLKQ